MPGRSGDRIERGSSDAPRRSPVAAARSGVSEHGYVGINAPLTRAQRKGQKTRVREARQTAKSVDKENDKRREQQQRDKKGDKKGGNKKRKKGK